VLKALREGAATLSLLDTTAGHVLVTATEIGKVVCIRKASRAGLDDFNASSSSSPAPPNTATSNGGFSLSLCSVGEVKLLAASAES